MAFLVVLESLTPAERAALLLHDVFGLPHAEVADAVGVSVPASRQLVHRARQHVEARRPRFEVDRARHAELVERFTAACNGADLEIGRSSCRERRGQYVEISVVAGSLKKKPKTTIDTYHTKQQT